MDIRKRPQKSMDVAKPPTNLAPDPNSYGGGNFGSSDAGQETQAQPIPENNKPSKPKSSKTTIIVVVFAILVTLVLAGVATYIYLRSNSNDTEVTNQTANQTTQTDNSTVSAEDIQSEIDAISTALDSLDDSADFGQNDLTNDQIGL